VKDTSTGFHRVVSDDVMELLSGKSFEELSELEVRFNFTPSSHHFSPLI